MTLLWSAVALIQVTFLPGFLIARRLRLDGGLMKTWVISFGLSLVVNYHLTLVLTLLGVQGRTAVCAIVAAELVALARLLRAPRSRPPTESATDRLTHFLCPDGTGAVSPARLGALLLGVAPLAHFAGYLPGAFSSLFVGYDALVSLNRWAVDWMNGSLPAWTLRYPQLVPANWAMLYTFVGAPIQFLAKGLSVLFPITTVLMFIDAGLRRSRPEYMAAAAVTAVLMSFGEGKYIASGYADLPTAFFALAAFYVLATWDDTRDRPRLSATVATATAMVIGAALTKQAGLYMALLFPGVIWWFLRKRAPSLTRKLRLRTLALVATALVLLILPWFLYKQVQITQGFETPGNATAAGVHDGRSYSERVVRAWQLWEAHLSSPVLFGVMIAVAWSAFSRRVAWITATVTIPYTLIWVLLFSYDRRNLALAFPFIGLSAATGAAIAIDQARALLARWPRNVRIAAGVALIAAGLVGASFTVGSRIDPAHDHALRELGNDPMNAFLYSYLEHHGYEGRILTNYRMMWSLPELQDHIYFDRNAPATEFWPFRNPDAFRSVLKRNRGKIRYVVVLKPLDLDVLKIVQQGIRSGHLQVLFRTRRGLIVRIREDA